MFGMKFLGKLTVPSNEDALLTPSVTDFSAASVLIPLPKGSAPKVKMNDTVKVGQLIGEAKDNDSASVHASVSGKVSKIEEYLCADGSRVNAVRIENDGLMTVYEDIAPPSVTDLDSLIDAVRASGLVGLGRKGIPTAKKLAALKDGKVDLLIVNAVECEPGSVSDSYVAFAEADYVRKAVELLFAFAPSLKDCKIAICKGNCAVANLDKAFEGFEKASRVLLPKTFPAGHEKIVTYNTTGRVVPEGKCALDAGVLVLNVSTLAFIAKYVETGMPLVSKTVTVSGSVNEPKLVTLPIGAPLSSAINACGGAKDNTGKVIFGGPMTGKTALSLDEPIVKTTACVTVLSEKECSALKETACIRCGRCADVCPMLLDPADFSNALKLESKEDKMEMLANGKVNLCIECGACAYVCPANRPLVHYNRVAKDELSAYEAAKTNE
jgi:electron transport complex protein RnfC